MEFNGTFLVTILTFIVFVFIMNKVLYAPILNIMEKRKSVIDSNYTCAQGNNDRSKELADERNEKLNEAKDDARKQYNESLDDYKKQKIEIIKEAQDAAGDELLEKFKNLENVSNEAKESLKAHMADLANDIIEKVLGYRTEIQEFDNETVDRILYQEKG